MLFYSKRYKCNFTHQNFKYDSYIPTTTYYLPTTLSLQGFILCKLLRTGGGGVMANGKKVQWRCKVKCKSGKLQYKLSKMSLKPTLSGLWNINAQYIPLNVYNDNLLNYYIFRAMKLRIWCRKHCSTTSKEGKYSLKKTYYSSTLSAMAGFQTHISKCSERGGKTKFLDFFS